MRADGSAHSPQVLNGEIARTSASQPDDVDADLVEQHAVRY
jgi:hypothetical protein